jgi:hypothetical protein
MWKLFSTLILSLAVCGTAQARDLGPDFVKITATGQHSDLQDQHMYQIAFNCEFGARQLPNSSGDFDSAFTDWFVHINQAVSQHMLISTDLPTVDDSNKMTLPAKAIALFTLYSTTATSPPADFRKLCTGSVYVPGGQKIYLITWASWSKQFAVGGATQALYEFTKAISPLWSLFAPIPAAIAGKVTNVQATEDPLKNIMTDLNQNKNYGPPGELLREGQYVVTSDYSKVTITVTKLPSLVRANSNTILHDFRAQLDARTEKLDAQNAKDTCGSIAFQLGEVGFSQAEDIPYALAYLAAKSLTTKQDIVNCLDDYALRAAKLGSNLWSFIPPARQITPADAINLHVNAGAAQPTYSIVSGVFNDFVLELARFGRSVGPVDAQLVSLLQADMLPTVFIKDQTKDLLFANDTRPLDASGLASSFTAKNFHRFDCKGPMTAAFGDNPEGVVAVFLAFKVPVTATSTTIDNVLMIRPLFEGGKVSSIAISDEIDSIKAILASHNWVCNGFAVAQPSANPVPGGGGGH